MAGLKPMNLGDEPRRTIANAEPDRRSLQRGFSGLECVPGDTGRRLLGLFF